MLVLPPSCYRRTKHSHVRVATCATSDISSLYPNMAPSLSDHVPADPPGTEHRCTTSDCPETLNVRQRQAKLPVPRVLADLVRSRLAVASLSSTAGFCRDHKTDAPCQQLGSLHMLSREDPCQIYELCHIQPNVLLLCELVG